jgi:hypothetical protein
LDEKDIKRAKDFIDRIHLRLSAKYSQIPIRKHPQCCLQLTSRNNLCIKCLVLWAPLSLPTSSPRGHSPSGLPPLPTGTPTLLAGGNTASNTMTCVRPPSRTVLWPRCLSFSFLVVEENPQVQRVRSSVSAPYLLFTCFSLGSDPFNPC